MRRIGLVLALSFFLAPVASEAQEHKAGKVYRIGVLLSDGNPLWNPFIDAFRWELRELGYVEGQGVVLEFRSPEGRPERLPDLAAELVRLKVDVILAQSHPAIAAAQKVTKAIPIVMVIAPDPIASGFAASLSWPSGNITGLSLQGPDLPGKALATREMFGTASLRNCTVLDALVQPLTVAWRSWLNSCDLRRAREGDRR